MQEVCCLRGGVGYINSILNPSSNKIDKDMLTSYIWLNPYFKRVTVSQLFVGIYLKQFLIIKCDFIEACMNENEQ